jgi:hypothetical protein
MLKISIFLSLIVLILLSHFSWTSVAKIFSTKYLSKNFNKFGNVLIKSCIASLIFGLNIGHADTGTNVIPDYSVFSDVSKVSDYSRNNDVLEQDNLAIQQARESPIDKNDFKTAKSDAQNLEKALESAQEKVLTLSAYFDEVERNIFEKNWKNSLIYLNTIANQEESFMFLIDQLHPSEEPFESIRRILMSWHLQHLFQSLDLLHDAIKNEQSKTVQMYYSQLLLSYDRYLKAGDLYPTYDPISSYDVLYRNVPSDALRFDTDRRIDLLDEVVVTSGPDMGKTGEVVFIENQKEKMIIKFDRDGKDYQEVKEVPREIIARAADGNARYRTNFQNQRR